MKPASIAFIGQRGVPATIGGIEHHVEEIGSRLVERGHDVTLYEAAARLGDFGALSAAAARDIPRAKRVVVADCGHVPHLEQPDQFLAEFLPFLAS